MEPLQKITLAMKVDKQEEYETLLGNKIPNEVDIYPPTVITSKGDAKKLGRARRKRLEVEVMVKINGNVQNVSKLWITSLPMFIYHVLFIVFSLPFLLCATYVFRLLPCVFAPGKQRVSRSAGSNLK